jgi:two-component system chemotaxis sensor kinase CheA
MATENEKIVQQVSNQSIEDLRAAAESASGLGSATALGKYTGLISTIVTMLTIVTVILLINLAFSLGIEQNQKRTAVAIEKTNFIREISNDINTIQAKASGNLDYTDEKNSLQEKSDIIDSTLNAFLDGGTILTIDPETAQPVQTTISRLKLESELRIAEKLKETWDEYKEAFSPILYIPERSHSSAMLLSARTNNDRNNPVMIDNMNRLLVQFRNKSTEDLETIRKVEYAGIGIMALMFLWTTLVTFRKLRRNDEEIDTSRRETQGILDTVKEGLFLLDDKLEIGNQHSKETVEIFESTEIGGKEFAPFLKEVLDDVDSDSISDFIKLLFDEHVIEDLISSLNPLEKVQTTFINEDGQAHTKYLNFGFFRVYRGDKIHRILVSVRDITARVLLEQELESTKEQGEQQVEMLVSFLHADPKMLKSFLLGSRESLSEVNAILKEPLASKQDLKEKLDKMFIAIHRMKGEASSMKFEAFAEKAHDFEDQLGTLKRVTNIKGIDFLPLTIELDKLISYVDTLNQLSSRLASGDASDLTLGDTTIMQTDSKAAKESLKNEWQHLTKLAETVAFDSGKKVQLVTSGLVESTLSDNQRKLVNDVSIQLIRNSIIHGIEMPDLRTKRRKKEAGRIDLRLAGLPDGSVELVVRDDGNGMNIQSIKKRVLEKGLASKEEVAKWSDQKVVSMAFTPGFSTSEETSMHAGRGVGLDIIRDSIKKVGGNLRLQQSPGKYCQFEIVLPAVVAA